MLIISDIRLTTVRPLHKTAHMETIDPTTFDISLADVYVPIFFAFRFADKSEAVYSQQVKRIKESLQKVLVSFFAFAGRWSAVPPGGSGRKLLCNDEGVPFIEAYMDKDLDLVVQASAAFQPVPDLQGWKVFGMDEIKFKQEMQPDGLPSILVQITRFACGGMVLAVNFNHQTTDGKGFFNFMTAWSDLSRTGETGVKVDHNRAQIEIPAIRDLLSNAPIKLTSSSRDESGTLNDTANEPSLWAMKVSEVSALTIEALKQEAKDGGRWVSTGDCITAHLWKSFAGLPSTLLRARELSFTLSVEGRTRICDPPVPDLCGNVFTSMLGLDIIAFNDLRDMPLISIATKLRNTLQTKGREDWLSVESVIKKIRAYDSKKSAASTITSWYSFPMYELDFGFGKPFFAGPNNCSRVDMLGLVYVCPPIPSSSSSIATVYTQSTPEVLRALEQNPHFSTIFLER